MTSEGTTPGQPADGPNHPDGGAGPTRVPEAPAEQEARASLFRRLGGAWAVDVAVELFYRKVLWDKRIAHFFNDVDMDRQIARQIGFLTMVFGGPPTYSGKDLHNAHRHLVDRGMTDAHFDAVVELLADTLELMGVEPADIAEVGAIAESVREQVLGRAT